MKRTGCHKNLQNEKEVLENKNMTAGINSSEGLKDKGIQKAQEKYIRREKSEYQVGVPTL